MANVSLILEQLKNIETKWDLIAPLKDEIRTIRLKASFLIFILSDIGKWHIEDGNLKNLLTGIRAVFSDVFAEIEQFLSDFGTINRSKDASSILQRLELINPYIQEVYSILSRSARSIALRKDEAHLEYFNFLIENLGDLLSSKFAVVDPLKEALEAVENWLRFLRNFLGFSTTGKRYRDEKHGILAELVAANIACLLYLCCSCKNMNDKIVNEMQSELLTQLESIINSFHNYEKDVGKFCIKALKAYSKSDEQRDNSDHPTADKLDLSFLDSLVPEHLASSDDKLMMSPIKALMLDKLHEEQRFLKDFVLGFPWKDFGNTDLDQGFKDLIHEVGYVICSLYDDDDDDKKNEIVNGKQYSAASDLLAEIKVVKEDARKIYSLLVPKSLRSNFPKTNGLGFVEFIFKNLNVVLDSKVDSIAPLKYCIEVVLKQLLSLRDDFTEIVRQEEVEEQWSRFKDIVYQTEYLIDLLECKSSAHFFVKLGLFDVLEEIMMIKIELKRIQENMVSNASSDLPSHLVSSKDELMQCFHGMKEENKSRRTDFVLFEQEADKIREQMTKGSIRLEILSIAGMPGVGKTTLADSLFQDFSITYHFHILARCSVTQLYEKKRVILELLKHTIVENEKLHPMKEEEDLAQKLYQSLKGRRYLIFMDDIWDIEPLKDLIKDSFPDDENGSRIMLTSRFDSIASLADYKSTIYRLSPVSNQKSWDLLQFKVFGNTSSCHQDLVQVGKKMARICQGLPLLIDIIAGVLGVTETKRDSWEKVAQSLKAQAVDDPQGRCRKLLELSYNHLPDHLKACFLYFGGFPKGRGISTRRLMSLWIAEGFVLVSQKDDQRVIEVVAENYLDDLIGRNLVIISTSGTLGEVKRSRVHDLLHDFALTKAKEDKFLLQIHRYNIVDVPTVSFNGYRAFQEYRLCLYSRRCKGYTGVQGPRVRTILCGKLPISFHDLCLNFILLRVLDLEENIIITEHYCDSIVSLIHLRYLSLVVVREYPSEIQNLQRLETFIVKRVCIDSDKGVIHVENICGMIKLRHFHLGKSFIWKYKSKQVLENLQLDNLQTLSCPKFCYGEVSENILKSMPNLRKLSCKFLDSWDSAINCNFFPKLELLMKLESLGLIYDGNRAFEYDERPYSCKLSFPLYLKNLSLAYFHLPWTQISVIGKLKHLEVLKLGPKSFQGNIWEMRDGEFSKLKYLSFHDLDIEEWKVSGDPHHDYLIPCLEKLHVNDCKKLKELPCCLAELATLEEIKLSNCTTFAVISARKIKREQEEYGNEQLVLKIRSPIYCKARSFSEGFKAVPNEVHTYKRILG